MTMSIEKWLQEREVIFLDDVNELRQGNVKICQVQPRVMILLKNIDISVNLTTT